MDKLCAYLNDIDWAEPNLPLDLVKIKLDHVIEEMIFLMKDSTTAPKPKPVEKTAKAKDQSKGKKKKIAPGGPTAMLRKAFRGKDNGKSKSEDNDFQPPKKACHKSEEPAGSYNLAKDGLEIESGNDEQCKRKKVIHTSDEDSGDSDSTNKKKNKKKKSKKKAKTAEIQVADVSTEEEDTTHASTKKGPTNTSQAHFKDPVPVSINMDQEAEFEDELLQPALGNLATHLKMKHSNIDLKVLPPMTAKGELHGISAASAKIMEGFLKDGKLNPAIERTQKGFYSVFASWILEDNLPSGAD